VAFTFLNPQAHLWLPFMWPKEWSSLFFNVYSFDYRISLNSPSHKKPSSYHDFPWEEIFALRLTTLKLLVTLFFIFFRHARNLGRKFWNVIKIFQTWMVKKNSLLLRPPTLQHHPSLFKIRQKKNFLGRMFNGAWSEKSRNNFHLNLSFCIVKRH
jgi:hypothetical protein